MKNILLSVLILATAVTGVFAQATPSINPPPVNIDAPWPTISLRALSHKPPKPARQAFERGMRAWKKNQSAEAGAQFARAVSLDPDYAAAHEMLGIYGAKTEQMDLALRSLERALELEPTISDFQANTALLLIALHRHADAEPLARRAVRLLPASPYARLVLGFALVGQEQATPEAAAALRIALERYPQAGPALRWVEAQRNQLGTR